MQKGHEYKVKLDLFEGPLDLLLFLVNKAEVAIVDISVAEITAQYLQYLDLMRELNIDMASEYLSMAATLLRLKAREMLPADENQAEEEESDDGIVSRQELIKKLLEYKKFKEAANSLRVYEAEQFGSFARGVTERVDAAPEDDELVPGEVGIFDLLSALQRILTRAAEQPEESGPRLMEGDEVKLDDRIEYMLGMIEDRNEVPFEELFIDDMRRITVVVTFMALLELVRMQKVTFRQERNLEAIYVLKKAESRKAE